MRFSFVPYGDLWYILGINSNKEGIISIDNLLTENWYLGARRRRRTTENKKNTQLILFSHILNNILLQ